MSNDLKKRGFAGTLKQVYKQVYIYIYISMDFVS